MLRPAPSSKLLNLTGFFSGTGLVAIATDIVARVVSMRALTKGTGCFVAKGLLFLWIEVVLCSPLLNLNWL
jgi:hypothetical protein